MAKKARERWFYVIAMPINKDGYGPASIPEAVSLTWEVWDQELTSHGSHEFLPDAIDQAEELNAKWETEHGNGP